MSTATYMREYRATHPEKTAEISRRNYLKRRATILAQQQQKRDELRSKAKGKASKKKPTTKLSNEGIADELKQRKNPTHCRFCGDPLPRVRIYHSYCSRECYLKMFGRDPEKVMMQLVTLDDVTSRDLSKITMAR